MPEGTVRLNKMILDHRTQVEARPSHDPLRCSSEITSLEMGAGRKNLGGLI